MDSDRAKQLDRVQKLMRLALNNPSHDESAAAALAAVRMIVEHQLLAPATMSTVERVIDVAQRDYQENYTEYMRRRDYQYANNYWDNFLGAQQQKKVKNE